MEEFNKDKVTQLVNLLEGIPLYKWEQLKGLIDREFKSQSNKTQFIKQNKFTEYLVRELTQ